MGIDFEKLRKHTEYSLAYEIGGEEVFTIQPPIGSKTQLMKIMKDVDKSKTDDLQPMIDFIYNLFDQSNQAVTADQKGIVKDFISENIDLLWEQTLIGYRITTKDKIEEAKEEIRNKLLEKKLT